MKHTSIILLSGGLDSTVSAAIAVKKTRVLFGLTIDYGQRAAKQEILSAKKICRALNIKHKIIELPFIKEFSQCKLISGKKFSANKFIHLHDIWVPNRNALFINIAAGFAEYYKADLIVTGFNFEEAQEFPDNRKEFIKAINDSLRWSTLRRVKVVSYVGDYTKEQIYRVGLKIKAPLKYIYSCYLGRKRMCGKCASCVRLKRILKQEGISQMP
ncbi:MAG: 7-cyano-7-deazaguanine synthase QueC [bacterium]